jgi:hypothetical protein
MGWLGRIGSALGRGRGRQSLVSPDPVNENQKKRSSDDTCEPTVATVVCPGCGTRNRLIVRAIDSRIPLCGRCNGYLLRCPGCNFVPGPSSLWLCQDRASSIGCGHAWNTFRTGGKCPRCGQVWNEVQCPRCGAMSNYRAWYLAGPKGSLSSKSAAGKRHGQEAEIPATGPSGDVGTVYDPSHTPRKLGEKIASGGGGSVWAMDNPVLARTVVKFLHPEKLRVPGFADSLEQKILRMRTMNIGGEWLALPYFPVYDNGQRFVGYVMRRVEGEELRSTIHPLAFRSVCGDWNRGDYIRVALDLVRKVKSLHGKGIILGDINPKNFLVNLQSRTLSFIDTDSYQFYSDGRSFRWLVGMPEYIPPRSTRGLFSRRLTERGTPISLLWLSWYFRFSCEACIPSI